MEHLWAADSQDTLVEAEGECLSNQPQEDALVNSSPLVTALWPGEWEIMVLQLRYPFPCLLGPLH